MVDKELPNVGNIHDDGWAKVFHELAAIVRASLCPMQADGRARRTIDNMLVRHQHYEVGTFARRSVIEEKASPYPVAVILFGLDTDRCEEQVVWRIREIKLVRHLAPPSFRFAYVSLKIGTNEVLTPFQAEVVVVSQEGRRKATSHP